jgi:flagellar motor switch protein FliM
MSKILSQEEVDALLSTPSVGETAVQVSDPAAPGVITYNFRRPDRVSKEQMRSLHFLHDRFARNVATSLGAYLRAVTELTIVSVEQFSYSEFLMSLSDPTAYYAISMLPLDGLAALELNPTLAFTIVDRMLGGSGSGVQPQRALTEIEQNVIDAVVKLILESLTESWHAVFDLEFTIQSRETRPQMLQVVGPNEVVILLAFDLRVGDVRGMLNLCIPASVIETTGNAFVKDWHRTKREATPTERSWLYDSLNRMPLTVTASLETRLRARELVRLKPGDVISLGLPIQTPVTVRIANRAKFLGRLAAPDVNVEVLLESSTDTDQRVGEAA